MAESVRQLAVLGSPIGHSRSPAIHMAAYRALGLPWNYGARDVRGDQLKDFLGQLDSLWLGLSLTMPLKSDILNHLDHRDVLVDIVGAANTVLIDDGQFIGFNTDVYGARRMLAEAVPGTICRALILGAGATARSVLAALAEGGTREVVVWTRSVGRSKELRAVAERLEVAVQFVHSGDDFPSPAVVISTLPGTAELPTVFASKLNTSVPLIDIAYDPWPTGVARHWLGQDGSVVNNGLAMLVYQALAQIRIFVHGDPTFPLGHEDDVLAAMRGAVFDAG